MRETALSERNHRALEIIVEQSVRLNRMIAAMLDVGRIANSHLALDLALLDVVALARRVLAELQDTLTQHTLICSDPGRPLLVDGDALRLEQVLQNLLQNAVKYSPAGGVVRVQIDEQGPQVCIQVCDQGVGIPPEAIPHLFQRFYRVPRAANSAIDGLGIGLYVVKEIVTLHGGTISVESREGVGSTFTVTLPLASGDRAPNLSERTAAPPNDAA